MEIGSNKANQDAETSAYDVVGSSTTNVGDGFTLVAVGDLIVTRALTKGQHPGFDDVVEILR
ncbi:CapA family protein, partial [Sinorhizobium meliloti]